MQKFFVVCILICLFFISGCAKKTNTTPVAVSTETVLPSSSVEQVNPVKTDSIKMKQVKACFMYIQMSLDSILAGIERMKQYDLNEYRTTVEKLEPYLIKLKEAVDIFAHALANKDDEKAFKMYELTRPMITTVISLGDPMLIKMIF